MTKIVKVYEATVRSFVERYYRLARTQGWPEQDARAIAGAVERHLLLPKVVATNLRKTIMATRKTTKKP